MNQREQKKLETRKKILEVAYLVYAKEGFSATTKQIAEVAEVSHGTIFSHFPDVESLLTALIKDFNQQVMNSSEKLINQGRSLNALLQGHIMILAKYEDFYKRLITEVDRIPIAVKYSYIQMQSVISLHISQLITTEELSLKDIPEHIIFNSWMGLLHYYITNKEMFVNRGSVLKKYKEELVSSFITMITK